MAKRQGGVPLKNPSPVKQIRVAANSGPAKSSKSKSRTESEPPKVAKATAAVVSESGEEGKQLKNRIEKLEQEVDQMAQERDFYYAKLRKIEDCCQENEEQTMVQQILEILYEADEERGFLPPEDEE
jgi:hypothetical protein